MRPAYDLTVPIPPGSRAWEVLVPEIPRGADLIDAALVLTPRRASVSLRYTGTKPDGTPHKRVSSHSVTLDPNEGAVEFIRAAFGKGKFAQTFVRLLPGGQGG